MVQEREARTWHYGLVAEWWAQFNQGGDDIDVFRQEIARSGEPVLDAGCGTGRLLLPMLREGADIDGSDGVVDAPGQTEAGGEVGVVGGAAAGVIPQSGVRVDVFHQAGDIGAVVNAGLDTAERGEDRFGIEGAFVGFQRGDIGADGGDIGLAVPPPDVVAGDSIRRCRCSRACVDRGCR